MKVPEDLRYSREHEWISVTDGIGTIGITDYAQEELGDVVFVELPETGSSFQKDGSIASLESVKAVSEVYSPVSGEVTEVNQALEDSPELINDEPYRKGWIARIKLSDEKELDDLMNAEEYREFVEEES